VLLALALAAILCGGATAQAQSYNETILYSIQDVTPDGGDPNGLIEASDGNFYTTTFYGGASTGGVIDMGSGTVLRVTPAGAVTILHTFCAASPCTEPTNPTGNLIQATDGNLYGTASYGGLYGQGAVFKVTLSGTVTTLYSFCGQADCPDGAEPEGSLVQGIDGALYGHAAYGGAGNGGTIFMVTMAGKQSVVYDLGGLALSSTPVQGSDGNFYGTASGGANNAGQIYKLTTAGYLTTVYSFCSVVASSVCTDGSEPQDSPLVEGTDGEFYGTTSAGGKGTGYSFPSGAGTLFKVTTSGKLTTLYNFCTDTNCADGAVPSSGPTLGSDGAFYGFTTTGGGPSQEGTFYRFLGTSNGSTYDTSWDFCEQVQLGFCTDVVQPSALLVQGSDGNFYSSDDTSYAQGSPNGSAFFKMVSTSALPAPITLTPSPGTVAQGTMFTLVYSVANATSDTMKQCMASSNGSFAGWSGAISGSTSKQTLTLTAPNTSATYLLALTCGGVESGFATLTVTGKASSTALQASPNPASVGQSVSLKATVTGSGTNPTGTVTFASGSTLIGTAKLSAGAASYTASTAALPPGTYPVSASYSGDATYSASVSTPSSVTLNAAPTATTLTANPTTVAPPATVTLTATVKRSASGATGTPTGSVTFSSGSVTIGTASLNASGVATFAASSSGIAAGQYAITAKYNGDSSDVASTSPYSVTVTVK
jgi:uncharacterized repeat protein (TIGR03803 family)